MPETQVSVVLPVFNAADFLPASIESVLRQSLQNFELIIIDDGSTDRSKEVIAGYAKKDSRIRFHHRANRGVVATLNEGMALARAPYIARMDADDIAMEQRLEKQLACLTAHPATVAVGAALEYLGPGGPTGVTTTPPLSAAAIRRRLPTANCISHPTVIMRKDAVIGVGGYRTPFVHAEDYDLWLRLMKRGDLENLPEVLLQYRVHEKQVSAQHLKTQAISVAAARAGVLPEQVSPRCGQQAILASAAGWIALLIRIGQVDDARRMLADDAIFSLPLIPRQSAAQRQWLHARVHWKCGRRGPAVAKAVSGTLTDPATALRYAVLAFHRHVYKP